MAYRCTSVPMYLVFLVYRYIDILVYRYIYILVYRCPNILVCRSISLLSIVCFLQQKRWFNCLEIIITRVLQGMRLHKS